MQRSNLLLDAMRAHGMSGLLFLTPSDVLMVTGYWPVMGNSLAFLSSTGKLSCIVPDDELELARKASDTELIGYEPATLDNLCSPIEALLNPLRELGKWSELKARPVGMVYGRGVQPTSYQTMNRFCVSLESSLRTTFPGQAFVPADALVEPLRGKLNPGEIDKLRRACALAGAAFSEAMRFIEPGRREDEIAADISSCFARIAEEGFSRGHGYFFCMSGPNAAKASGAYARTRQRIIQKDDTVMIHANTVGDGFWTDITRTYVAGELSDEQQRMQEAIGKARSAALAVVKPRAPAREVDRAAREVLEQYGFGAAFKHAVGHGVGFAATDPHALPRLHPQSPDILEPGMTFNIEPAVYLDGIGGMRHCDVVLCTEAGAEILTPF